MNRISKKVASDIVLFGLFWICIFGEWHTVRAFGDDASIYLVDFDETAYDLYLKGYYPSDYSYADFRRDSIESMTSHYVATDSNNFTAIVDTIENDVLQSGWSVIDNFFENAWINLKTGDITVVSGFTDDFKHTLDGRFKITPPSTEIYINGHKWVASPFTTAYGSYVYGTFSSSRPSSGPAPENFTFYATRISGGSGYVHCTWQTQASYVCSGYTSFFSFGSRYLYNGEYYKYAENMNWYPNLTDPVQYSSVSAALADFYGNFDSATGGGEPYWSGDGYYSNIPTDYNINLPALPSINWPSISTNNKTKYGVDFPDIDLTVDFQLPDSYYPQQVVYDVPYYLINDDSQPWEVSTIDWSSPSLPSSDLADGDASFFQDAFTVLPLGLVSLIVGVLICLLLFTIL